MWVNFKAAWNIAGEGWTSYRRDFNSTPPSKDSDEAVKPTQQAIEFDAPDLVDAHATRQSAREESMTDESPGPESSEKSSELDAPTHAEEGGQILLDESSTGDASVSVEITARGEISEEQESSLIIESEDLDTPRDLDSGTGTHELVDVPLETTLENPTMVETLIANESASQLDLNVSWSELRKRQVAKLAMAGTSSYQSNLFVGEFMNMTKVTVVALDVKNVVMCFTQSQLGGACRLANANASTERERRDAAASSDASANDSQLLPPLAWGTHEVFLDDRVGQIETVRLNSKSFVVCFERASDSAVMCSLGLVVEDDGDGLRCTYGNSLSLGFGRLISVASASAGRQLVVCHAAKGESNVMCRWADALKNSTSEAAVELRWADGEPKLVQSKL